MTFRDDRDALLARNDALEDEVARLKEELAAERARKEEPPEPKPDAKPEKPKSQKREPDRATDSMWTALKIMGMAGAGVIVVALMVCTERNSPESKKRRAAEAERARHVEENARRERWHAIVDVEPCLHETALNLHYGTRGDDPTFAWGTRRLDSLTELRARCVEHLRRVANDRALPQPARTRILEYFAAEEALLRALAPLEEYVAHKDFEDDDYAGATRMWADVQDEIAAYAAAAREARAAAIPAARAAIRDAAAAYERAHGRDLTVWRLEIGHLQRDVGAAAAAFLDEIAGQPGRIHDREAVSAAVRPAYDALIAGLADAPLEIRRDLRGLEDKRDYLKRYGDQAEGLYHLIHDDRDLLLKTANQGQPLLLDSAY